MPAPRLAGRRPVAAGPQRVEEVPDGVLVCAEVDDDPMMAYRP